MPVGGQKHNIGYEAPKTEIMKSSKKSRSGKLRTRSGHMSHRPERLGIDQYTGQLPPGRFQQITKIKEAQNPRVAKAHKINTT